MEKKTIELIPASKRYVRRFLSRTEKRLLKENQYKAWYTQDKKVLAIFFGNLEGTAWEGHWHSSASAKETLTALQESIKLFFKETQAKELIGYTDCRNIKALKTIRLLGFIPQCFVVVQNVLCLLTRKENKWRQEQL